MIVESVLGNVSSFDCGSRKIDYVLFDWYELEKRHLKKTSELGEELGIRLNHHLHQGDILYSDDTKLIVVELKPCELTCIKVDNMKDMGRLCFELGNRHLSLAISESDVKIPYDEPTFVYLQKLGFKPEKIVGEFKDFTVCHGHSHAGGHDHVGGHEHVDGHKHVDRHDHVREHEHAGSHTHVDSQGNVYTH